MIIKKETELNHPILILENQKEVDFILDMCYVCQDYAFHFDENKHKLTQEIIDKLN